MVLTELLLLLKTSKPSLSPTPVLRRTMSLAWPWPETHMIYACLITSQNYKNTYMDHIQRLWYKLITPSILKKRYNSRIVSQYPKFD